MAAQQQINHSHQQDQPPNANDAFSYIDHVKLECKNQPDDYRWFLEIMTDFASGRIDSRRAIERVEALFYCKPELVEGFDIFLPADLRLDGRLRVRTQGPVLEDSAQDSTR